MTSYAHLTSIETFWMTFITVLSNLAALPTFLKLVRQPKHQFQAIIVLMAMTTSFLYHFCQIYEARVFLDELQWHRLDNIFSITSFQLFIFHISGSTLNSNSLKWTSLLTTIIIQEKAPWEVIYTIAPIVGSLIIALSIRLYLRQTRRVDYNSRLMFIGLIFFLVALFFFVDGLDDRSDYLRISHGIWHVCCAIFSYFCLDERAVVVINKAEGFKKQIQL